MTKLAKKKFEKCFFPTTYIPLKGTKYDPVNRQIIEFCDGKNAC